MHSLPPQSVKSQSHAGFTLIETLVAVLILGIGLLGMLGVVVNSLKLTSSSNYRTIAAQQAYSMGEALRANPLALSSAVTPGSFDNPTASLTTGCLNTSGGCTRPNYISSEFYMWQQQLAAMLPNGQGTVCKDNDPDSHPPVGSGASIDWKCQTSTTIAMPFVVKICWNETRVTASTALTASNGGYLCTWTNI